MATGTDDTEVDPEDLQRQLSQIKDAVGLKEEYGTTVETWLVVGVLVFLASVASQYVYTHRLDGSLYGVIWIGFFIGGMTLYSYWRGGGNPFGSRADRPNLNVVLGIVYLGSFPVLTLVYSFATDLGRQAETLLNIGVILIMLGIGYVAAGHVMKAYYVRDRDRYPFFVGGIGMILLGVLLPGFEVLRTWPYLVFGGGYFAFAVATYAYLTYTD